MKKWNRHSPDQIIAKLRAAELAEGRGKPIAAIQRRLGISEPTLYRWRKQFGGMQLQEAKRLKALEKENTPAWPGTAATNLFVLGDSLGIQPFQINPATCTGSGTAILTIPPLVGFGSITLQGIIQDTSASALWCVTNAIEIQFN